MSPRSARAHPSGHRSGGNVADGHDHSAMVADFRRRFWASLALTVPILALSPLIQGFLGVGEVLAFPGDAYVQFALS